MKRTHVSRMVAALSFVLALASWTLAQGGAEPVKVKVEAGKAAAGQQVINVKLDIAGKWHVYANPVENEDLAAAATVVKVASKGKVTAQVKYPAGKEVKDKLLGTYKVYEGHVTIPVVVQRAAGDSGPLEVSVRFQACDDQKCLPPATVKHTVP